MKKFLAAVIASLAFVSGVAFAVPTVQQIESEISQGDWQRADSGLVQVLQAHPNSAHAHYLYAQVLHREGRYADALAQIEQAKSIDPQLHFASPSRFAQIESAIRSDAARANGNGANRGNGNGFTRTQAALPAAAAFGGEAVHHGPSMGAWIGIALLFVVIALVLRWTLRRAKSAEDSRAGDDRRDQLRRATELLNAVRSLKLDLKLSTMPGHDLLEREAEGLETQLRGLAEALSNSSNPVPPYQLDDLQRQVESLKARAEGRPDPNAGPVPGSGDSAYAREADANFGRPYQGPYPPQQPQQVIVQQGGGGSGMGGLLTGVLLGEMLGGGRERVVERDVLVDDDGNRVRRDDDYNRGGNDGGVDFGQGSNDWDDGSGGGGADMGGSDDSGNWDS
ncbi:MAG TPA: tetratricopeptide repeat protein [Paraburkholderia sp.]|jgi:hypothetical protein